MVCERAGLHSAGRRSATMSLLTALLPLAVRSMPRRSESQHLFNTAGLDQHCRHESSTLTLLGVGLLTDHEVMRPLIAAAPRERDWLQNGVQSSGRASSTTGA